MKTFLEINLWSILFTIGVLIYSIGQRDSDLFVLAGFLSLALIIGQIICLHVQNVNEEKERRERIRRKYF